MGHVQGQALAVKAGFLSWEGPLLGRLADIVHSVPV